MCLLVVAFGLDPAFPLVVGANRDEHLDRPATAMTVLADRHPRILGGRDELAGGTWLAVNDAGVVAGLTNRPRPGGRDQTKRSRGALPLALATATTATAAVDAFVDTVSPADYNAAWFLVGDRHTLYAVDLTDGPRPVATRLAPGLHILENAPLGHRSWKVDHVRALLTAAGDGPDRGVTGPADAAMPAGRALTARLRRVLADHAVPEATPVDTGPVDTGPVDTGPVDTTTASPAVRRPETLAACVHTDDYGTRSSTIIRVRAHDGTPPLVLSADGHPCTSPFIDVTALWTG